jgi:hypothetical protein
MATLYAIATTWDSGSSWSTTPAGSAYGQVPTVGDTVYLNGKSMTISAANYSIYCDAISNAVNAGSTAGGTLTISGSVAINFFMASGIKNTISGLIWGGGTNHLIQISGGATVNFYDCNVTTSSATYRAIYISGAGSNVNHLKSAAFDITGTISGTTLAATVPSGSYLQIGSTISGSGVTTCTVTAQTSGTLGASGNYTVSVSQTVTPSQTITVSTSNSVYVKGYISGTTLTVQSVLDGGTIFLNAAVSNVPPFTVTGGISNGSGGAGTILNVTAVPNIGSTSILNQLSINSNVTGTGVTSTTISALGTGTGGTGTYTVANSQLVAAGSTITISTNSTNTRVLRGTRITAFGTGSGGTGTYTVSASQTIGTAASPVIMKIDCGAYITTTVASGVAIEVATSATPTKVTLSGDLYYTNAAFSASNSIFGLVQFLGKPTTVEVFGNLFGSGLTNGSGRQTILYFNAGVDYLKIYGDTFGSNITGTSGGDGVYAATIAPGSVEVYGNIYAGTNGLGVYINVNAMSSLKIVGNSTTYGVNNAVYTGSVTILNINGDIKTYSTGTTVNVAAAIGTLTLTGAIENRGSGHSIVFTNATTASLTMSTVRTYSSGNGIYFSGATIGLTVYGGIYEVVSGASGCPLFAAGGTQSAGNFVNITSGTIINSGSVLAISNGTGRGLIDSSVTWKYYDLSSAAVNLAAGGTVPSPDDVRLGIAVGATFGNLTLPDAAEVLTGVTFGTNDIEFTGTLSIPSATSISTQVWSDFQSNPNSLSYVDRLHNVSTIQGTGDQLASLS